MAIQLYKPGNDHVINGFDCELTNCAISSLNSMLDLGWYATPGEWVESEEQDGPEKEEAQEDPEPLGIRERAQLAGIEGYDKKRIKTLEAELDEHEG